MPLPRLKGVAVLVPRVDARADIVVQALQAEEGEHLALAIPLLGLLDRVAQHAQGADEFLPRGGVEAPDLDVVHDAALVLLAGEVEEAAGDAVVEEVQPRGHGGQRVGEEALGHGFGLEVGLVQVIAAPVDLKGDHVVCAGGVVGILQRDAKVVCVGVGLVGEDVLR